MKILSILEKNSWKTEINISRSAPFDMKIRASLKNFLNIVDLLRMLIINGQYTRRKLL